MEGNIALFRERILERRPLSIRGGGSKDFYGGPRSGEILDTKTHAGIIDYQPSELVITARCGTPLAEINSALAARRQMLAFDPPAFAATATIGGMVAAGLSGPRRWLGGGVRDHLLGVKLMDGEGRVLRFGGQVMKNVAGFDVSRLLVGSLGTLGLILEVSLRVIPLPRSDVTLRFELTEAAAIEAMNRRAGEPLPLTASCWHAGAYFLRLSGAEAAVTAACRTLGGEKVGAGDAANFWVALREQQHAFFAGDVPLWRVNLPPTRPPLGLPWPGLIEWGGALRWLRHSGPRAELESRLPRGAVLTLFRGGARSEAMPAPSPAIGRLEQRVQAIFDPHGVFDRRRLFAES